MIQLIKNNKPLLHFTFFNLLDKTLIVLLPFLVLNLFQEQESFIQLEYILSTVNIIATVSDLGLNGYMFFMYQKAVDKQAAIAKSRQISEIVFILMMMLAIGTLMVHFYVYPIHFLLLFIIIRALFNYITTFLTSYFRLIDRPVQVLYFSLTVSAASLLLLLAFYVFGQPFGLWLIFIPQLALILYYLGRIISTFNRSSFSMQGTLQVIYKSLEFSWPSIVQVFLMVYMQNYGKINALDRLPKEDAVFLGYTLRFSMLIQLAHASLVGFYAKSILAGEDLLNISSHIMKLYAGTLILTCMLVVTATFTYQAYFIQQEDLSEKTLLNVLFALYTLFWCFYSYLEMYYARINKNRIKLYLTFVILFVFILAIKFLPFDLLQNIAYAMFLSILTGLIANILILKRLNFKLS